MSSKPKEINRIYDLITESVIEIEEAIEKIRKAIQSDIWGKEDLSDFKSAKELAVSARDLLVITLKEAHSKEKKRIKEKTRSL